ncbi:MAG TPA: cell division protein FtsQ/DivIB [Xanthomonadales bacterium]|nr:cell division protein FtsQ/DivIB [Xanthomonadales bacterium]
MNRYSRFKHASRRSTGYFHGNRGFSSGVLVVLLLFLVSVAGIVWVSMGIVAKEQWPIRWLEINGSFHRISANQLRGSLAPLVNSSFFTINLQQLQVAASRNSWLAEATVQKRWPDTVVVTIEEHVPLAHWNSAQLISTRGEVFAVPDADEIQGLPWLHGPDERLDQVLEHWTKFNLMLDAAGLEIDQLTLDERGAWSMRLDKGTHLSLGRDHAVERLARLMHSWSTLLYERDLPPVRVDLRYSNGFAVHWPKDAADIAAIERN